MGKFLKILGGLVLAVIVMIGIALWYITTASFQTGIVRKELEKQFGENARIESVQLGLSKVQIKGLSIEDQHGYFAVERVNLAYSLGALLIKEELRITDCLIRGLDLDLSQIDMKAASQATADGKVTVGEYETGGQASSMKQPPFNGLFEHADKSLPIWLDGVDVDGKILLPEQRTMLIAMGGGGIAPGKEGNVTVDLTVQDPADDAQFNKATLRGTFGITQGSPRGIEAVKLSAGAEVSGGKIDGAPRIDLVLALSKENDKEVQAITVTSRSTAGQTDVILQSRSEFRYATRKFEGGFEVNANQSHLLPFALGKPMPNFTITGESRYTIDLQNQANTAVAVLQGTISGMEKVDPKLKDLGILAWQLDTDLQGDTSQLHFNKLAANITREGSKPLLSIAAPENISLTGIDSQKPEITGLDGRPITLELRELPVAWIAPFVPDVDVSGQSVSASLKLVQQGEKLVLTSSEPFTLKGLSLAQNDTMLLQELDVSANLTGKVEGNIIQLKAMPLEISQAGIVLINAETSLLTNTDGSSAEATINLQADLANLMRQPVLRPYNNLLKGNIETPEPLVIKTGDHGMTISGIIVGRNILPENAERIIFMAKLELDAAAIGYDGSLTLDPAKIDIRSAERDGSSPRPSANPYGRLTLTPRADEGWQIDANLASSIIQLDDLQLLADGFLPATAEEATEPQPSTGNQLPQPPDTKPFWSGLEGNIKISVTDLQGAGFKAQNIELISRAISNRLEVSKASMNIGEGSINSDAKLEFSSKTAATPYTLQLNLDAPNIALDDLPVDKATAFWNSGTVSLSGSATASGANLDALMDEAFPQLEIVVEGTRIDLKKAMGDKGNLVKAARIGSGLGALVASRLSEDGSNPASKYLTSANYIFESVEGFDIEKMELKLNRSENGNYLLENLSLLTPQFNFTGAGTLAYQPNKPLAVLPLDVSLGLNAKPESNMGTALQNLGLLSNSQVSGTDFYTGPSLKLTGNLNDPNLNLTKILTNAITAQLKQALSSQLGNSDGQGSATGELLNTLGGLIGGTTTESKTQQSSGNQQTTNGDNNNQSEQQEQTAPSQEEKIINSATDFLKAIRQRAEDNQ